MSHSIDISIFWIEERDSDQKVVLAERIIPTEIMECSQGTRLFGALKLRAVSRLLRERYCAQYQFGQSQFTAYLFAAKHRWTKQLQMDFLFFNDTQGFSVSFETPILLQIS